jgi:hypothetical protein
VSKRGDKPTEKTLIKFVSSRKSFQFNDIADTRDPKALNGTTKNPFKDIREHVMDTYNFIGLLNVRRVVGFDEILWGLETKDLIVLLAKQAGGNDDGRLNKTCYKIQKPGNLTNNIQRFFTSKSPEGTWIMPCMPL